MKTNWILALGCLVVLGLGTVGSAEVIGDFEDGLGYWEGTEQGEPVLELSTLTDAVTLGRQCLSVKMGGTGYWPLMYVAPNDVPFPESMEGMALQFDLTIIQSEWTGNNWTKVANAIALNSDGSSGWKEFGAANINIIDRVTGQAPSSTDWGPWSSDLKWTFIVDISDYDLTGATWFNILISIQQNPATGAGAFYFDNFQLVEGGGGIVEEDQGPTADDPVIASFEQGLDGWEILDGELGDEILFSDQNGVTDANYSLDVFFPENEWHQFMSLNVVDANLLDLFIDNQKLAVDITRLPEDYPDFPTDPNLNIWNNFNMAINVWDNQGNGIWTWVGEQANWNPLDPNLPATTKAIWEYGRTIDQVIPNREDIVTLELIMVSNTNSGDYDGTVWFYLDNMQLFGGPKAKRPAPANYGINVPMNATLSWLPGALASQHHLYFGGNALQVSEANTVDHPDVTLTVLDEPTFDLEALNLAAQTVYYWRVDEINEANPNSPWKGDVWRFTTGDFWVLDDFEDYNDYTPDRVFDTWSDGYAIDENGAQIGYTYSPYGETEIVHSGSQSIPLFYENTDGVTESVVTRTWNEPQDFSINGCSLVKFYLYGKDDNTAGQLSVTLTDSANHSATVVSDRTDFYALEQWSDIAFELQGFVDQGVDVSSIEAMTLTIANIAGQEEAEGDLLIDDLVVGL